LIRQETLVQRKCAPLYLPRECFCSWPDRLRAS